jgi:hypothetical protein
MRREATLIFLQVSVFLTGQSLIEKGFFAKCNPSVVALLCAFASSLMRSNISFALL